MFKGYLAALALAALAGLAFTALATAATVTYRDNTAHVIGDGNSLSREVTVPDGRTPVADVEVAELGAHGSNGVDMRAELASPAGTEIQLFDGLCADLNPGSVWDIADGGDDYPAFCPAVLTGVFAPDEPLSTYEGAASGGTWTFTMTDKGGIAGNSVLGGWGIRVVHAPFKLKVKGKEQPLRPKLKVKVKCNADCDLTVKGQVRREELELDQNDQQRLKLKLKRGAFETLAPGEKAKVVFLASEPTGDTVKKKKKVPLG